MDKQDLVVFAGNSLSSWSWSLRMAQPFDLHDFSLIPYPNQKVRSVRTTSLQSSIQSLGGIQLLYLLFEQLDCALENAVDTDESQNDAKPFPIS